MKDKSGVNLFHPAGVFSKEERTIASPALEMQHITKRFSDSSGIADFSLCLEKGQILGVLGERGTGKTALTRILNGISMPDSGNIRLNGEEVLLRSPRVSAAWGIGCAGKENPHVAGMDVLEHLVFGSEYAPSGKLGKREAKKQAAEMSEKYGIPFDIAQPINEMNRADWLWLEIMRMLLHKKDILVLDEPDAVFTQQEMDQLISVFQKACKDGNSAILLSRHPETVKNSCEAVTVLRPGFPAETYLTTEISTEDLYFLIRGEKSERPAEKKEISLGGIVLEVRRLTVSDDGNAGISAHELSFEVRGGEILCLLGRADCHWDALAAALIGTKKQTDGRIRMLGKDISHASPGERIRAGIAYLPKHLTQDGFGGDFTLEERLALPRYKTYRESGWIKGRARKKDAERIVRESGVSDAVDLDSPPGEAENEAMRLILLSRELERRPLLLIVEYPDSFMSEKAAALIQEKLLNVRADHRAVLLLTSRPDEAMRLADRILVLHEGEIMGEFDPAYTSVRELGWYISGQWRQQRYGGGAVEGGDDE